MPSPLRKLLVENAPIAAELSAAAIEACLEFVPLGLPPGRSTDAMTHQRLLDLPTCAALREAVESRHDHERETRSTERKTFNSTYLATSWKQS